MDTRPLPFVQFSSVQLLSCVWLFETPWWFANIFYHSRCCFFSFLIVSFEAQSFKIWTPIYLFTLCCCAFRWHCLNHGHKDFVFMKLIVLAITFRSVTHFQLVLFMVWGGGPTFFAYVSICSYLFKFRDLRKKYLNRMNIVTIWNNIVSWFWGGYLCCVHLITTLTCTLTKYGCISASMLFAEIWNTTLLDAV